MAEKWTKEKIKEGLECSDLWVTEGIEKLYSLQTQAEQAGGSTKEDNGVGFNAKDCRLLSSFALQIKQWKSIDPDKYKSKYPQPLSAKQIDIARQMLMKYAGQLARVANGEI
jgi:hypothetical protein